MAVSVTALGTAWTTTAGNKTVAATPAVGDLIVVIAAATGVATSAIVDTQAGTYTKVDVDRTGFSTTGTLNAWIRTATIPAALSTTFTATQTSSTGGGLTVLSVSSMGFTGASALRSSGGQSTVASGTPAPVLSLTPLSTNPIITAIATGSNSTTNVVQRAGYTEDTDSGYNTPPTGLEVSHLASGESSATITYGGAAASQFASIALELAGPVSVSIAQVAATVTATGGTQTFIAISNSTITQVAATVTSTGGTQLAQTNSSNTQVAANVTVTGGTQTVTAVNIVSISQAAGAVTAAGGTQTIATVNNVSLTQSAAVITGAGGLQTITTSNFVTLSQAAANVTGTGGAQTIDTVNNVAVSPVAAIITAAGGNQSQAAQVSIAITQLAATITAAGGTQDITITSSAVNASINQLSATITAAGSTQNISTINNATIDQVWAGITATGGNQFAVGHDGTAPLTTSYVVLTDGTLALKARANNANYVQLLDGRHATKVGKKLYMAL